MKTLQQRHSGRRESILSNSGVFKAALLASSILSGNCKSCACKSTRDSRPDASMSADVRTERRSVNTPNVPDSSLSTRSDAPQQSPDLQAFLRESHLKNPTGVVRFRRSGSTSDSLIAENQLLVYFKRDTTEQQRQEFVESFATRQINKVGQILPSSMVQLEFPSGTDLNQLIAEARENPVVLTAIPNYVTFPQRDPTPNVGVGSSPTDGYWWINAIRARQAWDIFDAQEIDWNSFPIGIVDEEINIEQRELRNRIRTSFGVCNGVYSSPSPSLCDGVGLRTSHGTQVSAFAVASGEDTFPEVGVAWRAPLITYDFYDRVSLRLSLANFPHLLDSILPGDGTQARFSFAGILDLGIQAAMASGARVINISQGLNPIGWFSRGPIEQWEFRAGLTNAISTAVGRNVLVVMAAGNDRFNDNEWLLLSDSALSALANGWRSNVILVGATGRDDCPSSITARGNVVEISAPGDQMRVLTVNSAVPFPTDASSATIALAGSIIFEGGTSYAAPLVAGAAHLVWSLHPTWTAQQVKQRLLDTARHTDCRQIGHGILDVGAAIGSVPSEVGGWGQGMLQAMIGLRDGGAVIFSTTADDLVITKLRSNGVAVWSTNLSPLHFHCGEQSSQYALREQSDNSILVTCGGLRNDGGLRLSSDGRTVLWQHEFGFGEFTVGSAEDNQMIVTNHNSNSLEPLVISRIMTTPGTPMDRFLWNTTLVDCGGCQASDLLSTQDGWTFVLAGRANFAFDAAGTHRPQSYEARLMILNPTGLVESGRIIISTPNLFATPPPGTPIVHTPQGVSSNRFFSNPRLALLNDRGVLVLTSNENQDGVVQRYTRLGARRWSASYGSTGTDFFQGGADALDGGVYVVGTKDAGGNSSAIWLLRLDRDGNRVWERTFTRENEVVRGDFIVPVSDGFLIGGTALSSEDSHVVILPVNQDGRLR